MILSSPAVRKTLFFAKDVRWATLHISHQLCYSKRWFLSSSSSSPSEDDEGQNHEERSRALNYLETWVGTSSSNTGSGTISNHKTNNNNDKRSLGTKNINDVTTSQRRQSSLTITNSSYLLPTLRIERHDTPESLSSQLHSTFASAASSSSSTRLSSNRSISILLQSIKDGSSSPSWKAPIILDLQAIMPDGSPHYQAPPSGSIQQYKRVLAKYGLQVVGISNCPKSFEEECVTQAGLPLVWGIATKTNSQDKADNNNYGTNPTTIDVKSALQLVLTKIEEGDYHDDQTEAIVNHTQQQLVSPKTNNNPNNEQKEEEVSTINRQNHKIETVKNTERRKTENNKDSNIDEESPDYNSIMTPPPNSKIYYGSIRSGQQISTDLPYQSLIVIGSVNSGGECMADGDIYIFGKLRGRVLAGLATASSSSLQDSSTIQPQQTYRIFASNFDPELVCIGGTFTTVGKVQDFGLKEAGGAAMVTVDQKTEDLMFESIVL